MQLKLFFVVILSFMILGCNTSDGVSAKASSSSPEQTYKIQIIGSWISNADVFDSNNQKAIYAGKGVYVFKTQPQGSITLTGGTFEKTNKPNRMNLKADASAKTLSTLDSFYYQYPHLKNVLTHAIDNNKHKQSNTSKIIYLMASNNLLSEFSSSLKNAKSYNDIIFIAKNAAEQSNNSKALNVALMMISLSFFDITNPESIALLDGISPTVKISPTNNSNLNLANGKKPEFILTFSESVKYVNNSNVTLSTTSGNIDLDITEVAGSNKKSYTAKPSTDLQNNTSYKLTLKNAITDHASNKLAQVIQSYTTNATTPASTITRYVTNTGAGLQNGKSWGNAYNKDNLQLAIDDVASRQGSVWVAKGVYKPGFDPNLSFELKDGVKLYGGFSGGETNLEQRNITANKTILSGDLEDDDNYKDAGLTLSYRYIEGVNSNTVITLKAASSTDTRLDGFYITAGKSTTGNAGGLHLKNANIKLENTYFYGNFNSPIRDSNTKGGAIQASEQTRVNIKNSEFIDNSATNGAAIFIENSSLSVDTVKFNQNYAKYGGAIANKSSSSHIQNTIFKENIARSNGGAIYYSTMQNITNKIDNSSFLSNDAVGSGGAIYNDASSNQLTNITFNGNTSKENGGAIYNINNSNPVITNSTFAYNTSFPTNLGTRKGGAIYNNNSAPKIINSTFYNNQANEGGAMFSEGNDTSAPVLANCILWNNETQNDEQLSQYAPVGISGEDKNIALIYENYIKNNGNSLNLIKKSKSINSVEHIYYELGQTLSAGLSVTNNANINVPNTDQLGNSRTENAVYKGAIQIVNTTDTPTPAQAFIKKFNQQLFNSRKINLEFSRSMTHDTLNTNNITFTDKRGNNINISIDRTLVDNKRYTITLPNNTGAEAWYTLSVSTGVKDASGNQLNRQYNYEIRL